MEVPAGREAEYGLYMQVQQSALDERLGIAFVERRRRLELIFSIAMAVVLGECGRGWSGEGVGAGFVFNNNEGARDSVEFGYTTPNASLTVYGEDGVHIGGRQVYEAPVPLQTCVFPRDWFSDLDSLCILDDCTDCI